MASSADRQRAAKAKWSRENTATVSDIGKITPVKNRRRRNRCRLDLEQFLTTYFPNSTGLSPFSEDHKRIIGRLQRCTLDGGRFANAVYRGAAKTTIAENTAIWATVYGHRRFVPLFGADGTSAGVSLDAIKMELSENDLLYEDFPEVCHAIRHLEGRAQRAGSQTYNGNLTHIEWTAELVRFPTIPKAAGSGAIIAVRGIGAGFRGLKIKMQDGTNQRPDMVLLDDIQTDEIAGSELQVKKVLTTIRKAIGRLGGHRRGLAMVCNGTPIQPNDVMERLLVDPAWQAERVPMVKRVPDNLQTFWLDRYREVRNGYDRENIDDQKRAHADATQLYRDNREEADAGAEVSWESCYDPVTEISALQHAMNALIDDGEEAFASECQVRPLVPEVAEDELTAELVLSRANGMARRVVPVWATRVTAAIDVQRGLLYYALVAFGDDFTAQIIDYGTLPRQPRLYFTLREASPTLETLAPGAGKEAQIRAGLDLLVADILGKELAREGGSVIRVCGCLCDASWGESTDTVYEWARRSQYAASINPSHGRGIGATQPPLNPPNVKLKQGEQRGLNWHKPIPTKRVKQHVVFDANFWKSFLAARFNTAAGAPGRIEIFGKADEHKLFADHICAERGETVTAEKTGRKVVEWSLRSVGRDNHWLDCAVLCCVAASMHGAKLAQLTGIEKPGPTKTLREMREEAQRFDGSKIDGGAKTLRQMAEEARGS